jgi:hypothetical protein
MADKDEYYYPPGKPPGKDPYDPLIGHPAMKGRRWQIAWDKSGKELPKLKHEPGMDGTRVLDAGETRTGFELEVTHFKDYFK